MHAGTLRLTSERLRSFGSSCPLTAPERAPSLGDSRRAKHALAELAVEPRDPRRRHSLRDVREPCLRRDRRDGAVALHGLEDVLGDARRWVPATAERLDHAVAYLRVRLDAAH